MELLNRKQKVNGQVIAQMGTYEGSIILDVRVTSDDDVYPMVTPGHSTSDMIGLHPHSNAVHNASSVN